MLRDCNGTPTAMHFACFRFLFDCLRTIKLPLCVVHRDCRVRKTHPQQKQEQPKSIEVVLVACGCKTCAKYNFHNVYTLCETSTRRWWKIIYFLIAQRQPPHREHEHGTMHRKTVGDNNQKKIFFSAQYNTKHFSLPLERKRTSQVDLRDSRRESHYSVFVWYTFQQIKGMT